eukprot:CAMPEP_0172499052 /NCGR_PEP_ID=MMETSP1066-20121228/121375_1 /TAXON_ID=671091 /ORGANISM="Coscinodiscus wailesii, Strain CCMP2513" /LENGTH=640 /DNA_ID=CAMNT_0013272595 /DNA_START=264 /DNA_END=2186 /DNA_ORIENTATION=-
MNPNDNFTDSVQQQQQQQQQTGMPPSSSTGLIPNDNTNQQQSPLTAPPVAASQQLQQPPQKMQSPQDPSNPDSSNNPNTEEDVISIVTSGASTVSSFAQSLIRQEEETFYSAEENKHGDDNLWGLLSGVAGNIYEWYDFAVYGLLSTEIGHCFFPQSSKELQLINSFGVFLAAFLMRPIGAIMFGEIGDRIFGRKNALIMSIVLITVPSVLMGLLPTYNMIGPTAPICLVILRMMQGLSVGGQLAGSYVISIEQSTSSNRGFRGSICDASSVGGFVLASAVTNLTRQCVSEEAMDAWAWRIPFWVSLLLAPILYQIVKRTEESKFWAERTEQKETEKIIREVEHKEQTPAVLDLLASPFRRRQLMGAIGVLSCKAGSFYMLFLWTPIYMAELRGIVKETEADFINLIVVSAYIVFLLIGGKLSDSFPHRSDLLKIGVTCIIFACPTMFGMFESESKFGYLLAQLQYAFVLALVHGGIASWEVELWMADPSLSFTGVAMGHNVAATIFGGTMPLVATSLYYWSESFIEEDEDDLRTLFFRMLPAAYISALGLVSLFCLSFVIRHPHDLRTGEKKLRSVVKEEKRRRRKMLKQKKQEAALQEVGNGGYWASPASTFGMESVREEQNRVHSQSENVGYVPPST